MDDTRTRETLDALADLFLTGTAPGKPSPIRAEQRGDAQDTAGLGAGAGVPTLADELDGPAPFRLPPQPTIATPRRRPPRPVNPPSPAGDDAPMTIRPGRRTARDTTGYVEAVFIGNLPGFAGPWLTQYAHAMALRRGPVGLLHLSDARIELDLLCGADRELHDAAAGASSPGDPVIDIVCELADADPAPVRRWLVHLPTPTEQSPPNGPALRTALQLERWTILCGADDMAIGSAERTIRALLAADEGQTSRRIGLAVMGADESSAGAAVKRLARALRDVTDTDISLVDCRPRMEPVLVGRLGAMAITDDDWPPLRSFLEEIDGLADDERPPSRRSVISQIDVAGLSADADDADDSDRFDTALEDQGENAVSSTLTEQPPAPTTKQAAPTNGDPHAAHAKPQPQGANGHASSRDAMQPDLAQFLAGAVSLEARCPDHANTQLVLDQAGRLHLLVRHCAQGDPAAGSLRAALLELIEAREWVHRHLDLLALTQRQCRFDKQTEPALHLFTDDVKTAVALTARLGEQVKLHLLKAVHIGDAATWFCEALN